MSFLQTGLKQQQKANLKISNCSLLFEKILRKFDNKFSQTPCPRKANLSSSNYNNMRQINKENVKSNKVFIDLNRKMKIARVPSKDSQKKSESNKQNIADNGATYSFDSGCSDHRQHSDILRSFENKNRDFEQRSFLDVNQFLQCENYNDVRQIIKEERKNGEELQLQDQDLPDLVLPNRQPSQCEVMLQQKPFFNFNALPTIQQEVREEKEQKKDLKNEELQIPFQLKTRLSLRILKKKLKNNTIQQVIDDVTKHHKIQFYGCCSQPQKSVATEALMSFMKNLTIN